MKNRKLLFFFIAVLIALAVFPLSAQKKVTLKLASLVPENTPWGQALNRMAVDWAKATNGEVELIIYHGGSAGDEAVSLRKLNLNQIQIALFTSMGLNQIVPEILSLSYPLLIQNNEEFEVVLTKLRPELDRKIQEKNYITLAWAKGGWLNLFSKRPIFTPADLRGQKLGSNPDELEMMQAFRAMGYQAIPVGFNDTLVALNSSQIEAIYMSPIQVAAGQWFGVAPQMASLNIAPFMGALVMNQAAWRRIPEKYRPAIQAICKRLENEINNSVASLEKTAINTMVQHGLKINQLSPQNMKEWQDDIARNESKLAGPIFNNDIYRKIVVILDEYRKGK